MLSRLVTILGWSGFPTNQSWFIFQTQKATLGTEEIAQVLMSPTTSPLPTQSVRMLSALCSSSISEHRGTEGLTSHPDTVSIHMSNEQSSSRVLFSQELSLPYSKLYHHYPAECLIYQCMTNDKMIWVRSLAALLGGNPFPLVSESWGSGKEKRMKQRRMEKKRCQCISL